MLSLRMAGPAVVTVAAVALFTASLTLQAGGAPRATLPAPGAGWDPAAAATYLDARMDAWWENAKSLKTGDGETKCVSCHTAVPYLLARPALRRALGAPIPTAHEDRIVESVRQRVSYASTDRPYYDHTDAKKIESRGVEAVINALVLTSRDLERRTEPPSPDTTAALARMWDVQRADGAWDWLDFGLEPYEAPDSVFYGATVAALAAGSPSGRRASASDHGRTGVDRLRRYLQTNLASQRLFNRVWALLASSRFEGFLDVAERDRVRRDLAARQRADGGWSLADLGEWRWTKQQPPFAPPGVVDRATLAASDGYATGLVVHALRRSGARVDDPLVRRGQQWLRDNQSPARADDPSWAPWRAYSLNFNREQGGPKGETWRRMFMSDLATAFAALALL
jgi:squalene-hopene/tetraprenyl-beta-curcumene cyclase